MKRQNSGEARLEVDPRPAWLVKTQGGRILGPMATQQLHDKIKRGELDQETQVCPANAYWFSLDDPREVSQWLGNEALSWIKSRKNPLLDPDDETTDTAFLTPPEPGSKNPMRTDDPGLSPSVMEARDHLTQFIMREKPRFLESLREREASSLSQSDSAPSAQRVHRGAVFMKEKGWLIVLSAALLGVFLIRLIRSQ